MKKIKQTKGITIIALVVTIILMLILAGIVLSLTIGENGLIRKAQNAGVTYEESIAREKLELVLLDMQSDKVTNREYNQDNYLTSKIRKNGMIVNDSDDSIVFVDGWKFRIDRSIPKIIGNLGKGEIENPYKKENLLVYLDGTDAPINQVWKDRSGNNHDAVMTGDYVHDAKNKAYRFTKEKGLGCISKFEYKEGITISACIQILEYDPQQFILIGNGYAGSNLSRPTVGVTADSIQGIGGYDTENNTIVRYPVYEDKVYTVTLSIDKEGKGKVYLNGELISNLSLNISFPTMPTNDFRIRGYGSVTNEDYNTGMVPCNIYNVLVYDGALLEDEVNEIYQIDKTRYIKEEKEPQNYQTEDLLLYLDGEDAPVDHVWKDRSGNNHNAVMSGVYTHDIADKSYNFTQENGQGRIAKFNYTNGITISARIRVTLAVNDQITIGNGYAGGHSPRPTLIFTRNSIFMVGGTNGGNSTPYSTLANREYTITMTIDKLGNGKSYINGKLISSANLGTSFPAVPLNDFRIRGYGATTNEDYYESALNLPVAIHNVLVYDKDLSQNEIKHIYEVDKLKY